MRLLILTQYFWPEHFIINDLVKTLKAQGHDLVVATGKPNYPDGKIFEGYQAKGVQKEFFDGDIPVFRVPLRPRGKSGALNLILNYLSFILSGLRYFSFLLKGYSFDVVLTFNPSPITSVIPAILLKQQKKSHLAIWVQDLWPESLAATGFIKNRFILKLVGLLVRAIYSATNIILVQSPAFKIPVSKYAQQEKIIYYPNSMLLPETSQNVEILLPDELLKTLKTYFCVVFAGNIGTAQAIETLVEAAVLLKDMSDVKVILVGSGSMSEWAHQKKVELNLDNLVLAGRFSASAMPEIYSHAGCLVVSLKDEEIFSYTVPYKIQSYLAAGKPIIAALNGEGARVVIEAKAGLTCPAEDPAALANCVRRLYGIPESERAKMGAFGKKYFLEHFEMTSQAKRLVEILEQRMTRKGLEN
jgi:glycosyltransferase involved in cell wall biosynthesis